jgi:hypothetical protein
MNSPKPLTIAAIAASVVLLGGLAATVLYHFFMSIGEVVKAFVLAVETAIVWIVGLLIAGGAVICGFFLVMILIVQCFRSLSAQIAAAAHELKAFSLKQAAVSSMDTIMLALIAGMVAVVAFVPTSDFVEHPTLYRATAGVAIVIGMCKVLVFAPNKIMVAFGWGLSSALSVGLAMYAFHRLGGWHDGQIDLQTLWESTTFRWQTAQPEKRFTIILMITLTTLIGLFPLSHPRRALRYIFGKSK